MKVTIEIEVNEDFQPCTYGCEMQCPFGHIDDDYRCVHLCRDRDGYEWTCPVKEAIEKGDKYE